MNAQRAIPGVSSGRELNNSKQLALLSVSISVPAL
jgi:hypothetical protein